MAAVAFKLMKKITPILSGAIILCALLWIGYFRFETSAETKTLRVELEHEVGIGANSNKVTAFFKKRQMRVYYDGTMRLYQISLDRDSWRRHKILIQVWMDAEGCSSRLVVEDIYTGPFGMLLLLM